MGIYENIDIDFAKRTLRIIEQYDQNSQPGPENFEVTLLINCLVGLLVLPHERRIDVIPDVEIEKLVDWGIDGSFTKSWGAMKKGEQKTLRQLVRRLRNSIAHFQLEVEGTQQDIERLKFSDRNGFRAVIPVAELRLKPQTSEGPEVKANSQLPKFLRMICFILKLLKRRGLEEQ